MTEEIEEATNETISATCLRFYLFRETLTEQQMEDLIDEIADVLVKHGLGNQDDVRSIMTINPRDTEGWPEDPEDFVKWLTESEPIAIVIPGAAPEDDEDAKED